MAFVFNNVKQFSQENNKLHDAMVEYARNYNEQRRGLKAFEATSKERMESAINAGFINEVAKRSRYDLPTDMSDKTSVMRYCNNPTVQFFANEIAAIMIDMILPQTLMTSSISYITEFEFKDLGDTAKFDLKNNQYYTVSKADYRKRNTNMQKLYGRTVTLTGVNHMITIGQNLFDILIGFGSIADDVMKATVSMERQMLFESYDAFTAAMGNLSGNLAVTNYSSKSLMKLCQTVEAYNQGRKPVILGTAVALNSVLPTNANYRYLFDDSYVKNGYLQTLNGYDVVPLSQVADPTNPTPYSLKLDDTKIYVASPASDKIVKTAIFGGTFSSTNDAHDMANKNQFQTIEKSWETAVITNSVAGIVTNLG